MQIATRNHFLQWALFCNSRFMAQRQNRCRRNTFLFRITKMDNTQSWYHSKSICYLICRVYTLLLPNVLVLSHPNPLLIHPQQCQNHIKGVSYLRRDHIIAQRTISVYLRLYKKYIRYLLASWSLIRFPDIYFRVRQKRTNNEDARAGAISLYMYANFPIQVRSSIYMQPFFERK